MLNLPRLLIALLACALASHAATPKIKVMLLTGQSNKYHNWAVSSPVLKSQLDSAGIFDTTVVTSPPTGADNSNFAPNWSDYQVIVVDYDGDEWPEATKTAFTSYMRNGGGFVSVHATDNSFPKWTDFLEMTGVGGWNGRNRSSGPAVYWDESCNCAKFDTELEGGATHPPKHDFLITLRDLKHPVTAGLPPTFMHAQDEIYSRLRGPAKNLTVLATSIADPATFKNATGRHEPMLMTIDYGKGRVFHTTLGHVGAKDTITVPSLSSVAFIATFQRGTEWAATGKVTQAIPADFPTAEKPTLRAP